MERFFSLLLGLLVVNSAYAREPLPKELASEVIAEFQYESIYEFEKNEKKPSGLFSNCWNYEQVVMAQYPQAKEPLEVKQTLYIPSRKRLGDKKIPTVIMVPPLGGVNPLDTEMAKTFCKNEMAAILIENDFANVEYQAETALLPVEDHQLTFYRISAAVKAALGQIDRDENLNPNQVGIFGVSLGGILSSFVMASQSQIGVGYFVVAGGDIPEILAYSEQEKVVKIRKRRMEEQNFSDQAEYEAYLREYVTYDPIDLGVTMLPETIYMVIAGQDPNVQTENQWLLHQAFSEPEHTLYKNAGHTDAIINTLLFGSGRRKVADFFEKRFREPNPRPEVFEFLEQFNLNLYM